MSCFSLSLRQSGTQDMQYLVRFDPVYSCKSPSIWYERRETGGDAEHGLGYVKLY